VEDQHGYERERNALTGNLVELLCWHLRMGRDALIACGGCRCSTMVGSNGMDGVVAMRVNVTAQNSVLPGKLGCHFDLGIFF
jgi:hypothetical protein